MTFRVVNGSTHSENGWRLCDRNECEIVAGPFMNTAPLRKGAPAIVLGEFVRRYHQKVAPVISPVWGWSLNNDVLGGWGKNNGSNHLAATSVDINAPQWPWGLLRMPDWLVERIELLRKEFEIDGESGVFWGRVWSRPDEMHFQMAWPEGDPRNDRLVAKLLGQTPEPTIPRKVVEPAEGGTFWCDVSQYQSVPIDSTYTHRVFSFRTNSGDKIDTLAVENARVAKEMLDTGALDIVIPYYFFRPGQANCDLHREILETAGLFNHPRTVTMVDVEGDNGSVSGNNSWEINDEIGRIILWYKNSARVIGYLNSNADPGLWSTRNGINLVVPQYNRPAIGDISSIKDPSVRSSAIAHQFTSTATDQSPWLGRNVDVNWSPYSIDELLQLFKMVEIPDEKGLFVALTGKQQQELYDKIMGYPDDPNIRGRWPSRAIFRDDDRGVDDTIGMVLNADGNIWDVLVIIGALAGVAEHRNRIERLAAGEGPNGDNERFVKIAQDILQFIQTGTENSNV